MSYGFGIGKSILLGVCVGIIVPIVFLFAFRAGAEKEREYTKNGVLTPCVVDSILTVGGKQQVYVVYRDAAGKSVKAKAVLNKKVTIGQTVEAYVLSSKPDEVYHPGSPIFKWILYAIIAIAAIGAWIPLVLSIRQKGIDKLARQVREMNKDNNNNDFI